MTSPAKWVCACGFGVRIAVADFKATRNRCQQKSHRSPPASLPSEENQ